MEPINSIISKNWRFHNDKGRFAKSCNYKTALRGESMSIPKIIHYCWFGDKEIPEKDRKNIEGWKKLNPDYEFRFWNEQNYDVKKNKYMKQAYEKKKLGFVPDYARTDIIYQYGGFYFDTDVELLKPLDELLENECIMGFQNSKEVNHGQGFAAVPKHHLIKGLLDVYENLDFVNEDGSLNLIPSPVFLTQYLKEKGLQLNGEEQYVEGALILPTEYFCPIDYESRKIEITKNTIGIHHYAASWHTELEKVSYAIQRKCVNIFGKKRGDRLGKWLSFPFRVINKFNQLGARKTFDFALNKIKGTRE